MKPFMVTLGFVLVTVGLCSMVLDLMGLQFTFMRWLSYMNGTIRAIIYMFMCFFGVALMYLNLVDWRYDPDAPSDPS